MCASATVSIYYVNILHALVVFCWSNEGGGGRAREKICSNNERHNGFRRAEAAGSEKKRTGVSSTTMCAWTSAVLL